MIRPAYILFLAVLVLLIAACDPMAPQPTPFPVIVSAQPSLTPTPRATDTPTPTRTPFPSPTPDLRPTVTPFPCDDDTGQIIEVNDNFSEIARENLRYHVYIPPCYAETQVRYPYVILLHGLSFREQQWADIGAIEALDQGIRIGALPPMILVMPYFGNIGQFNTFPPDASYETIILEELVPAVEADFCTIENREFRAIGGISRGGFWAYSIGLRHPDVFGRIGGHSPIFPENLNEVPAQFNPLEIAENSGLIPEAGLELYLDNGASDSAATSTQRMSNRLEANSIAHTYRVNTSGQHNNEYWSAHVSEYLAFYGDDWARSYDELPTCLQPSP